MRNILAGTPAEKYRYVGEIKEEKQEIVFQAGVDKAYKGLTPLTSLLPFDRLSNFFREDEVSATSWIHEDDFDEQDWFVLKDATWNKVVGLINPKKSPGYPKVLTCRNNAACLADEPSLRMELESKINTIHTQGMCIFDAINNYDYTPFTCLNDPNTLKAHALHNYRSGVREFVQLTNKGEAREFGKLQRLVCAVDLSDNNVERLIFGEWLLKSMDKQMGDTCMAPRLDIMSDEEQSARLGFYDDMASGVEGLTSTDQPGFEYGVQLQDYMDHMYKSLHDHDCLIMENFEDGVPGHLVDSNLTRVILGFYYSNISRIYVTNEGKMFVNTIAGIQVSGRFMTFKLNSDVRAMRSFTVNVWLPAMLAFDRDHLVRDHFAYDITPRFDYTLSTQTEMRIVFGLDSFDRAIAHTMDHWFCETAGDDCVEIGAFRDILEFEKAYRWFGWNVTDTVVQKGEYDFCSTKFTPAGSYQTGVWKALFVRCYKNTEVTDLLNFFLPFKNHPDFCKALPYIIVTHPDAVIAFAVDYCGMVDDADIKTLKAYGNLTLIEGATPDLLKLDWYYDLLSVTKSIDKQPLTTEMQAFLNAYTASEAIAALNSLKPELESSRW